MTTDTQSETPLVMRLREYGLFEAADTLTAQAQEIAELRAKVERDAGRLDWIESAAAKRKVEIAKSLYGTGFEIGEWPELRVTVRAGSLRDALDAAIEGAKVTHTLPMAAQQPAK